MPRKTDSNNPADWIFIAESELEGIRLLAQREISFSMCHSKLAEILEKVIKAELIRAGWFLLKIHDLEKLLDDLRDRDAKLADEVEPLVDELAEVYFINRYPGFDLEDADWPQLRGFVDQVAVLLEKVKARIAAGSTPK